MHVPSSVAPVTTIEYFPAEPCNVRKDAIEAFAAKFAEAIGYEAGDDLDQIVKNLGGRIVLQSFGAARESEASIRVHEKGKFDIFLPAHTTFERDRFSIAHELGHYVLHYPLKNRPMEAWRFGSNRVEWEANWFAAGFLMPEKEFRKKFDETGSPVFLARHFKVSVSAVQARMKALALG